jgi:hypothetical protein
MQEELFGSLAADEDGEITDPEAAAEAELVAQQCVPAPAPRGGSGGGWRMHAGSRGAGGWG